MEIVKVFVPAHLFRGLRNRGRLDHNAKDKLDLTRLRARKGEKPRTKAGQVRQAWPDIKALFDAGHSLKDIWIWLNEIGIGPLRTRELILADGRRDRRSLGA